MDHITIQKFKQNYALKTLIQETQFGQWLSRLFYLNEELHKEYDSLYQESYYVKLHELLTEGKEYAEETLDWMIDLDNRLKGLQVKMTTEKIVWYNILIHGLKEIRETISDEELGFMEYKRHSASHIFQNNYEVGFTKSGKLKTHCKGEDISVVIDRFKNLLITHGMDKGFDLYVTKKLYHKISKLYSDLNGLNKMSLP